MTAQLVSPDLAPQRPGPSPRVRIVRGDPTDAEVAALVAGLMASTVGSPAAPVRPATWTDRSHQLRTALHPGPDAWRWSLRH